LVLQSKLKDEQLMVTRSKMPTRPAAHGAAPARDTYIPGDALPVPEVIEKNSDSVWALWSEAVEGKADRHEETQPATLLMGLPDIPKDPEH
jgi:hypothetical protein